MDDKTWAVSSDAVHSEKRIIKSLLLSISKKILKIFMGCGMSGLNAHNDAYGNKVPSRLDVQEGTKGTKQFVIEKQGEDWAKLMENANN